VELAGGLNLYPYAPNALSWIDPLGLRCGDAAKAKELGYKKSTSVRTGSLSS